MRTSKIRNALMSLPRKRGILLPADVVEAARPKDSPLHNAFEWNEGKAAHKYRLWQARQLIVSVRIAYDDKEETIAPVFVSLKPDRLSGGYRMLSEVLNDSEHRQEMLRTAIYELKAFQERFERFRELAEIFKAVRKVEKRIGATPRPTPLHSAKRRRLVSAR